MLKKFTTLLCIGALAVAFVGCEQAGDAADDAAAAVGEAADTAAEATGEAATEAAEAVKDAASEAADAATGE